MNDTELRNLLEQHANHLEARFRRRNTDLSGGRSMRGLQFRIMSRWSAYGRVLVVAGFGLLGISVFLRLLPHVPSLEWLGIPTALVLLGVIAAFCLE